MPLAAPILRRADRAASTTFVDDASRPRRIGLRATPRISSVYESSGTRSHSTSWGRKEGCGHGEGHNTRETLVDTEPPLRRTDSLADLKRVRLVDQSPGQLQLRAKFDTPRTDGAAGLLDAGVRRFRNGHAKFASEGCDSYTGQARSRRGQSLRELGGLSSWLSRRKVSASSGNGNGDEPQRSTNLPRRGSVPSPKAPVSPPSHSTSTEVQVHAPPSYPVPHITQPPKAPAPAPAPAAPSTASSASSADESEHLFKSSRWSPSPRSTTQYHFTNRASPISPIPSTTSRSSSASFRGPMNIDEVLPFAMSPFAAWDPAFSKEASIHGIKAGGLQSGVQSKGSAKVAPGWHDLPPAPGGGRRRIWRNENGAVSSVYKVGWEAEVLDLEARLHETLWEESGGRHTMVDREPRTVLDLGTGLGLWPISQALAWPDTQFVAVDLVPCHVKVDELAAAEERARSWSGGEAEGTGVWAGVASRIAFQQFNFLKSLPFDSGVFDMVHIRFVGLGVPDTQWASLLDEAVRVLRPNGVLEIVEMTYAPPPSTPPAITNSFSSLLLSDCVPNNPLLSVQLHLPATAGLVSGTTHPVLSKSWIDEPVTPQTPGQMGFAQQQALGQGRPGMPGAIADAAPTWIRSALEYKGTGMKALRASAVAGERAIRELQAVDARWGGEWAEEEDDGIGRVTGVPLLSPLPPMTPPVTVPLRSFSGSMPARVGVGLSAWVAVKG